MALLTFDQQVLFQGNARLRIIYIHNVMDAVTICTDWLIRGLIWIGLFEQFHGFAMKVGDVGIKHVGGNPILIHNTLIGMTFRTEERRTVTEGIARGILDIMYPMTIDTSGHIGIAFLSQGSTMNASLICFINFAMALGTSLWNVKPCIRQQFTRVFVCQACLCVGVMAISADRCVSVTCGESSLMDTIQYFLILLAITLP